MRNVDGSGVVDDFPMREKTFLKDVERVNALVAHANLMVPHIRLQRPSITKQRAERELAQAAADLGAHRS